MAKLIIQNDEFGVYVYRESDKHFRVTEPQRRDSGMRRISFEHIDENCRVEQGEYMVIPITHEQVKAKSK